MLTIVAAAAAAAAFDWNWTSCRDVQSSSSEQMPASA